MKRTLLLACAGLALLLSACGPPPPACPPGLLPCFGICTDPGSDPLNCGACGLACLPGQSCIAGQCGPVLGDVTMYWRFVGAQGQAYGDASQVDPGCAAAGVDEVQIRFQGPVQRDEVVTCVQVNGVPGVVVLGLPVGTYVVTTEGLRGGLPVYAEQRTMTLPVAGVVDVVPSALHGDLNVFYDFPAGVTCAGGGLTEIAFELYNLGSAPPFLEYSSVANVFVPCRAPPDNGFIAPSIPPGAYRLRYLSALQGAAAANQVCGVELSQGAGTQSVSYLLPPATATCP